MGFVAIAILPTISVTFAITDPYRLANAYSFPMPNEPELVEFLSSRVGLAAGKPFRGSTAFWTGDTLNTEMSRSNLWFHGVSSVNEYSQLVTPQAIYFIHELFKRNLAHDLNWFRPWINTGKGSFSTLFRAFRALGVRYVGGYEPLHIPGIEDFRSASFPRRAPGFPSGLWVIHEIPDVNVGNYSPTDVTVARSAADTIDALASPKFDFSRQAVLSAEVPDRLVPARDMQLSVLRGGLHVSGRSDGTSLVVLPQEFSNCLRARDERVRLVRADLILTGVIFSGNIDTDISFDYGIFSPGCRRADFADMKQLGLKD